jgi:hypothetical protein
MAEEALTLHLEGMAEAGEPMPDPSELGAFDVDPDVKVAAIALIAAEEPRAGERVNVWLPRTLIAQLDAAADDAGKSRSAFIVEATRQQLIGRPSLTNMERIEALVRSRPGLSKSEIAKELFGVAVQQRVNADVNWLVDQGRIVSDNGWPARFSIPAATGSVAFGVGGVRRNNHFSGRLG